MSSFYVGSKSISKLANSLALDICDNPRELAARLYALNRRALIALYGSDRVSDMIDSFEYDETATFGEDIEQKLQSLKCFLYQCSEGDVDKSRLFRELESVKANLQNQVAMRYLIKQYRFIAPMGTTTVVEALSEKAIENKSWV